MKIRWILIGVCSVWLVLSCGGNTKKNTLGGLKYKEEKEEKIEFKKLNHEEVREEYQELLDLFEDEALKEQIERRIADVYMMEGVQDQLKVKPKKSYYVEAIKSYREILEKYPNSPDNAEVFYQLAKAYDMEGDQKEALKMLQQLTSRHPNYKNISEALFRMGDIYFNYQQYKRAENAYRAVTVRPESSLDLNARYMLGWSLYKQLKYHEALQSFAFVLNSVLTTQSTLDGLSKTEKPLIEDTLHSISLTLARSGGPDMIATAPLLANHAYVWMVYENLGAYYLEKERFEDAASTYRLFVQNNRHSEHAPTLHKKLIESYITGGFPLQAVNEKEEYVSFYGIRSNYKGNVDGLRADIIPSIKQYLDELARHYHANGQKLQKEYKTFQDQEGLKGRDKKLKSTKSLLIKAFYKAADYYQEYMDSFPGDPRTGEMTYLKAEAYYAAFDYPKAITEYERVAYALNDAGHKKYGANAGYAAIISYQKIIDDLKPDSKPAKKWQQSAVESMLRFAEVFHADERSPSVLTNAAEYLFSLDQYERALQVSSDLINKNPSLDKSLKKTAHGIMAHSYFKLENYQLAEDNYALQRALVSKKTEEYKAITERLAATIFKKTEGILAVGDKTEAVKQLLRLKTVAPHSPIRITAQYDAATMLLELESWGAAILEFKDLLARYPKHELAVEFPRKIAFGYEKKEDWIKAGSAYLELSKNDPDDEIRREALFLSANMYENAKDYETAITLFKRYAYNYEQPFDTRMEARYHLAKNYAAIDDKQRQLYWLRRIVDGDKKGGDQRTERSRWLAAWANIQYGDYFAWEFKRKRLRLPLDKSLPRKNKALQDAITRYQMAVDYGFLEFVTMSSVKIADLYLRFSQELRQAPVPKGLSSEERNMYAQILEEQASPFEELAVGLYQANVERAWGGAFNEWIEQSFSALRKLQPERFNKQEYEVSYGDEIR